MLEALVLYNRRPSPDAVAEEVEEAAAIANQQMSDRQSRRAIHAGCAVHENASPVGVAALDEFACSPQTLPQKLKFAVVACVQFKVCDALSLVLLSWIIARRGRAVEHGSNLQAFEQLYVGSMITASNE